MTESEAVGRSTTFELEAVIPDPAGQPGVNSLLLTTASHGLVVTFAPVAGDQQVVALDVLPLANAGPVPPLWRASLIQRQSALRDQWERNGLPPLPQRLLRQLPYRYLFRLLNEHLSAYDAVAERGFSWAHITEDQVVGYSDQERDLMPLLRDAFTYSQALLRGEKNPSKAVADDRAISVRTAQGRIAKARALNLLTAARPGQRIGELTPFAIDLLRRWYGTDLAVHGEIRGFGAVAKDARGSPDTEGAEDG